jgi:choline kinase
MTLIGRQIATLRGAGVTDIVIATGYRAEMLRLPGTRRVHNPVWETTNMVETLFCAEAEFSNDMIVAYSDIVYEPRVLRALMRSPHEISVVIDRRWRSYWEHRFADPLADAESLRVDRDGRIIDIGGPVADIDEIEGQYIGLIRFRGTGVDTLRRARAALGAVRRSWMGTRPVPKAYLTDLLMEMILRGEPVHAVTVENGWLEIDTVEDYETASSMFEDGTIRRFFDPVTDETKV